MGRLTSRSRALVVVLCLALCVCERVAANQVRSNVLAVRAIVPGLGDESATTAPAGTTTNTDTTANTNTNTNANTTPTNTGATTTQQTTTNTQNTGTTTQNTGTTQATATNTQQTQPTDTANTSTNTQQQTTAPEQTQPQPTDSVVSTTDANGSLLVTTVVVTPTVTDSSASSASSAAQTSDSSKDGGGGIGTGSIIGMSVAGGVAVIGVIAFFIWKFTRKRYSDFDDEPIKWPELNSHSDNLNYALPTNPTANTGAGTGVDSASEVDLARNASNTAYSAYSQPSQYSHPGAADSTADLYAPGGDPYAVPPLPHLNPNQPYHDDPTYGTGPGYYDPYRGPVPQAFNDAASVSTVGPHGGEAIPMSNLAAGPTGRRSPGPQIGLDMGRASPQPSMAGRQSPGPSVAYAGRTTPGLGGAPSGRHSPGPGAAYGGGY